MADERLKCARWVLHELWGVHIQSTITCAIPSDGLINFPAVESRGASHVAGRRWRRLGRLRLSDEIAQAGMGSLCYVPFKYHYAERDQVLVVCSVL